MLDLYVAIEGGEHDDLCFWKFVANGRHGLDPRTAWQASIDERYIWLMSTKFFDRLSRVRGLSDVQHVRLRRNNHSQTFPINGHVVDRENSDLSRHRVNLFPTSR